MEETIQSFNRAGNISRKDETVAPGCDASLFVEAAEGVLNDEFKVASAKVESLLKDQDYAGAISELTKLAAPIDGFFDAVMVMDKDEAVKNNRLALLKSIDVFVNRVADFSKIVL
jgi:glycyl-tRNA synthetase beta chain